jgi:aryl-alcohol dehydrogenase-like predicted oxidoreductase
LPATGRRRPAAGGQHPERLPSAELARSNGLTPAQLALAFCYRRRTVASTLIGVTSGEQLRENIGAWSVTLNDELLASIDALHLRYTNPAP